MKQKDASPAEIADFAATRRANDPNWYNTMTAAPPATIERETLYVLVELQRQLLQIQKRSGAHVGHLIRDADPKYRE